MNEYIKLLMYHHLLYCRSYTDLSETLPWRIAFDYRPVPLGFVVSKVALEQISLRILRFPPVGVFRSMPHIRSLSDASDIDG